MEGKFILISKGASPSCPVGKLDRAIDLAQTFEAEALLLGGGLVVLGSDEPATLAPHGGLGIFHRVVPHQVERYLVMWTGP